MRLKMQSRNKLDIKTFFCILKKDKIVIKMKCSSVLFSLFVSNVNWSTLFLFCGLSNLFYSWDSYQWCSVNNEKQRCRLLRVVFMKQVNELFKVLNSQEKLSSIFFLRLMLSETRQKSFDSYLESDSLAQIVLFQIVFTLYFLL